MPNISLDTNAFENAVKMCIAMVNYGNFNYRTSVENTLSHLDEHTFEAIVHEVKIRTSSPPLDEIGTHDEWIGELEFDPSWLNNIQWKHTNALLDYRMKIGELNLNTCENLNQISLGLLENSYNPTQNGNDEFLWRGLVVGNVQSGKTANFTTLISRAYDVGYKLVLVLSGRLESLRKQTASRLHQELIENGPLNHGIQHITEASDDIFKEQSGFFYEMLSHQLSNSKCLIVSKKERQVLDNLISLFTKISKQNPEFSNIPILIIDDESDEAGIDIGKEEYTSKINFQIKRLLSKTRDGFIERITEDEQGNPKIESSKSLQLNKRMYVGFTATPYATVFQKMNNDKMEDEKNGSDLYPHDYLLVLKDPVNYCSGITFFGRDEINDISDHSQLFLPNVESSLEQIEFIDSYSSCEKCNNELIDDSDTGQIIRSHSGKGNYNHFWSLSGRIWPEKASNHCDCDCHKRDESHLIINPFNDSIENFFPEMVESLQQAVDDFILAGAARMSRGFSTASHSMMVLISINSAQHFKIREQLEKYISTFEDCWPDFGYRERMTKRWKLAFEKNVTNANEGVIISGGLDDGSDKVHPKRSLFYSTTFESLESHILPFVKSINHVVLNSSSDEYNSADTLEFEDGELILNGEKKNCLNAIYYGGYSLGRGLTLKNLLTTYLLRQPGDGTIATQMQRWCGYRSNPGEDILDLMKIYISEDLVTEYREMLSVETINRHALNAHSSMESRPADVFYLLRESNSFPLVSAAKRGEMMTVFNPLSGKEKLESTFFLSEHAEEISNNNWMGLNQFLSEVGLTNSTLHWNSSGYFLKNIKAKQILQLLKKWTVAPHSRLGFSINQIIRYIETSCEHGELLKWNLYIPSRVDLPKENLFNSSSKIVQPLAMLGEVNIGDKQLDWTKIQPWVRRLYSHRLTPEGDTYRFKAVTSDKWRIADLVDPNYPRTLEDGPLLIITPIYHPSFLSNPYLDDYGNDKPLPKYEIDSEYVPILPSLAVVFPGTSSITNSMLGHNQFHR